MDYTKKLLEVRDLHKAYSKEGVPTKALNGITFDVLSGEYLGIMGASGSGKTTLLNCIATVIKPTSGQILLSGANISAFDGAKLAEYRGNRIGYLFQDFALLDNLTGRENILLPLSIHNIDSSIAEKHLNDIAGFLGITDVALLKKSPNLVTKHELCNVLWGTEECIDENALQVTFTRLRKTLREFGLEERIETVRGQGYRLKEQVRL